ncbi:Uncharacterised protein [uncultured archaeon]|nr:Uncharacterised protein [uncultured archaeon]
MCRFNNLVVIFGVPKSILRSRQYTRLHSNQMLYKITETHKVDMMENLKLVDPILNNESAVDISFSLLHKRINHRRVCQGGNIPEIMNSS